MHETGGSAYAFLSWAATDAYTAAWSEPTVY